MRKVVGLVSTASQEQGMALLSAILFMVMMASVSVVLVGVVVAQSVPSNIAQKSSQTIYAAQTGMQTTLAVLRSIPGTPDNTGKVYGDTTKLPCTYRSDNVAAPLTGNVNGSNDGIKYSVVITYYDADPTNNLSNTTWVGAHKITCTIPPTGTSPTFGVSSAPAYAYIVSLGIAPTVQRLTSNDVANRTLSAIYQFKVSNVNIPGGRIYDFNKTYCFHAATATAGSVVNFIATASCTNDTLELWIYDTDYKIKLASTTSGGAAGLCITGPVNYGEATQNATLQACKTATDPARWNQLWSWVGGNTWQGQQNPVANGPSQYHYLGTGYATGTALTGKNLLVTNGGTVGEFGPSSAVGPGAASYTTHQIVSYKEFGRCADVTSAYIGSTYLISYPCKQDPTGTGNSLAWNHKWYYTEPTLPATSQGPQQIYVYVNNDSNQKYCLTTPTAGNYPIFTTCATSNAQQNWTRSLVTNTYGSSYLFTDNSGRCLTVDPSSLHGGAWSKLTVVGCDGSDSQKWNASSKEAFAKVGSYKEGQ